MKRLLLTSAGLRTSVIRKVFLEVAKKSPTEMKILFIPTAAQTEEEIFYANKSKKELINLGIKEKNIIEFSSNNKLPEKSLNNLDAVYVCGGNTFYLLDALRKSEFDKKIKKLVESGVLYIGVSAGSIIAGPSIEVAVPFDSNDVKLKELSGLRLTDIVISPHADYEELEILEKLRRESKYSFIPLTNKQALLVEENKFEVIGL